MPIILTPLTLTSPWAHRDYGQTSDDCDKHIMYSKQDALSLVFLDQGSNGTYSVCFQMCGAGVLERGREEEEEVKDIFFGSGMLTTKYPGAVSGTNSNKSFSKGTVVNSRVFFFCAYFRKRKAPSAHVLQMALWTKRKRKNKRTIFLFTLASPNVLYIYFNNEDL